MRKSRRPIVIASRRSELARRQSELVGAALGRLNPHIAVEYRWIETEGDRVSESAAARFGGKGLFVGALENALLAEDADIAVHSAKDLPAGSSSDGLTIAAIPRRADARDCLISADGHRAIDQLPPEARVGTSSPRRAAQIQRLRPDLRVVTLRGNVDTRLRKTLEERVCDATLLAMAGLLRGGWEKHAVAPLDPDVMLPAASQGALAVQCRADDHVSIRRCLPLNDPVSAAAVHAERAIVAGLGADCDAPVAVYAEPIGTRGVEGFRLRIRVLSIDGRQIVEMDEQVSAKEMTRTAKRLVVQLIERGADNMMSSRQEPALR